MKGLILVSLCGLLLSACSSAPILPVQAQAYAALSHERVFENDFHVVWKALEEVMRKAKVVDRDPSEVDTLELKALTRRTLETDWVYTESRDKYQEYSVNNTPRKVYLMARIKYRVEAKKILGGVQVVVNTIEEIDRLRQDGSSAGYSRSETPDPSRANEILDKIQQAILAASGGI
jgi:hypothetical protein